MRFEEFRHKLRERNDKDSFFTGDYILKVNGNLVDCWSMKVNVDGDYCILIQFMSNYICNDTIGRFDLDGTDYKIEWFILEKEDE